MSYRLSGGIVVAAGNAEHERRGKFHATAMPALRSRHRRMHVHVQLRQTRLPGRQQMIKKYRGTLRLGVHGEGYDILFLGDDDPLAEVISDDIEQHGRYLTARYWTAGASRSDGDMAEGAIREMLGAGDA